MKNINIYSEFEFLIEVDGKRLNLMPSNHIEIDNALDNVTIMAYPLQQKSLSIPFAFSLSNTHQDVVCNTKNVKVYNFKNRCDVFLSPFLIPSTTCLYTNSHTIKNTRYLVCVYEDRVKISSNKGEYTHHIMCKEGQSEINGSDIYILVKDRKKTLLCFDTTNATFKSVSGDRIDISDNEIVVEQNANDMAKHVNILKFKPNLEKLKTEIYKDENRARTCSNQNLIPYNFFESIMCQDKQQAFSMLSDNLQDALKNQDIFEFFGEFDKINITSLNPLIYTLYSNDIAKDYKIQVVENKITEIEDVNS